MNVIDYEKLSAEIDKLVGSYQQAPYPYAVIDDLFNPDLLDAINQEVTLVDFEKDCRDDKDIQVKTRSNFADNEAIPSVTKAIFDVINGGKFLKEISRLTGIQGLISELYYDGGGLILLNKVVP